MLEFRNSILFSAFSFQIFIFFLTLPVASMQRNQFILNLSFFTFLRDIQEIRKAQFKKQVFAIFSPRTPLNTAD